MSLFVKRTDGIAYDISSYGTENPQYVPIMIDKGFHATWNDYFKNNPVLDDPNSSVGADACKVVNLCVPAIYVPEVTRKLVNEHTIDKTTGKPTDADLRTAQELHEIADGLKDLPDFELRTSDEFAVGNIIFAPIKDIELLGYKKHKAINAEDLPDTDFSPIAKTSQPLVTNDSVPCRKETKYPIPELKPHEYKNKTFDDLLSKFNDLLDEPTKPIDKVTHVSNEQLTERIVDGQGSFDWIMSALFHQLSTAKNKGLITNNEVAQIYSNGLVQGLQTAVQFVLEKDRSYYANLLQLAQMEQMKYQALLAKAELLMFPAKMELAFAQLEEQKRKIDLLQYQIELQKIQIPKESALIDQIREQTSLICIQKKQALEQLAQAELDRKMKEAQIETAVMGIKSASVDIQIKEHQANQAEIQTQQQLLQTEALKEDIKIKNTQWQAGLLNLKMVKVQTEQIRADIKLKAQQLLKDKEQVELIKAQVATAYAQVTATSEAIKAAKAQYSDTIDGQPVGGVIGAQIILHKMQAEAFERDSMFKFVSLMKDGWTSKKASDIATLSPVAFTAFGLDRAIAQYAVKLNFADNMFELPANYTDYLTDEQMDGTEATPSSTNSKVRGP